jgi:hypothetical protein
MSIILILATLFGFWTGPPQKIDPILNRDCPGHHVHCQALSEPSVYATAGGVTWLMCPHVDPDAGPTYQVHYVDWGWSCRFYADPWTTVMVR